MRRRRLRMDKCNSYLWLVLYSEPPFLLSLFFLCFISLCVSPQGDGSRGSTVPRRRAGTLLEILCQGAVFSHCMMTVRRSIYMFPLGLN